MQKTINNAANERAGFIDLENKIFDSLEDMGTYLNERFPDKKNKFTDDLDESTIEFVILSSYSKSYHILFYDFELLKQFNEGNELFVDGTFDICPSIKGLSQFLTIIMCRKNNVVSIISIHKYVI